MSKMLDAGTGELADRILREFLAERRIEVEGVPIVAVTVAELVADDIDESAAPELSEMWPDLAQPVQADEVPLLPIGRDGAGPGGVQVSGRDGALDDEARA